MTYEELKTIGYLTVMEDQRIHVRPFRKLTAKRQKEVIDFINENRQAIIDRIRKEQVEEEERRLEREACEAATIRFYSSGWETHEISIDTRKDIDEQIASYANYYRNDCTFDSLKADYEKAVAEKAEAKQRKALAAETAAKHLEEVKALAKQTGGVQDFL